MIIDTTQTNVEREMSDAVGYQTGFIVQRRFRKDCIYCLTRTKHEEPCPYAPPKEDYLSTSQVYDRMDERPPHWCSVFLYRPRRCDLLQQDTRLFMFDEFIGLYSFCGMKFVFRIHGKASVVAVDDIESLAVCHEMDKPWTAAYVNKGQDRWLVSEL